MGVPYFIVVEEHEYEAYKAVVKGTVLVLPQRYLDEYDTFWPREEDNKTGPGPARNFCWDHAIENGHAWHWVFDDNIERIMRFNDNMKTMCVTGTPLFVVEEFVLRYTNIAQAGLGYAIFCPQYERRPAIRFNTRIYSGLLIRNDIPFRWRGRYNEDTDLSLRCLKAGWVTAEFNAFLIDKRATQSMQGGNTAEFYAGEGTEKKSRMLAEMHPDVAKTVSRFHRDHHVVDYARFGKNKLIRRADYIEPEEANEFGMRLVPNPEFKRKTPS